MKDKNLGFRLFVILLVIGLSAWSLKDSIGYHSLEGDAKKKFREDNPKKVAMMQACGVVVAERVPLQVGENRHNSDYLATKASKSGHIL